MEPLPLEPDVAELQRQVDGLAEVLLALRNAEAIMRARYPWERMASANSSASVMWQRANESRRLYCRAARRHWNEIRSSGSWGRTGELLRRVVAVGWTVARLYYAAAHYSLRPDLSRDQAALRGFCG